MNESVYGGIRFNTNVYGYVLSSATTIIYKQRVKVLSAVECPPYEPIRTREKTPYRYLEPSRDLLEWRRMGREKKEVDCFVPFIAEKNATVAP